MDKRGLGFVLLVLVISLVGAGCGSDGTDRLSSGTSQPNETDPDISELVAALRSVGSGVDSAPQDALAPSGTKFCGTAAVDPNTLAAPADAVAIRQCFLDHVAGSTAADMVEVNISVEGDPIVTVWRALDGGSSVVFTDSTRDAFGSGQWSQQSCASLSTTNAEFGTPLADAEFYCVT